MKTLTTSLFASLALAATSFAGHEMYSGKDVSKDKNPVLPPTCFGEKELQIDVFYAYQDGNAGSHAGPIRDNGHGGGIGINYFFSKYVGIGAEGYWVSAENNASQPGATDDDKVFHNVNGMVIFRLPIDEACIAPYAFVGGGAALDGQNWAVGFTGIGLEYRVVPNKLGLFIDSRWNYYGDRFGHDVQNNFTSRAGVRWVF
jgi:hypothetical protein